MFGRHPRLQAYLVFGIDRGQKESRYSRHVDSLRKLLKSSYQCAAEASSLAKDRQKTNNNQKVRGASIQKDDRVLVHEGRHKIADRLEEDTYIVLE